MKHFALMVVAAALAVPGWSLAAEKEAAKAGTSDFPDLSSVLNDLPPPPKPDPKQDAKKPPKPEVKPDLNPGGQIDLPPPAPAKAETPKADPTPAKGDGKAAAKPVELAQPARPGPDVSHMIFDGESIRQVVNFHMPEIQECFEKVIADTGKKYEGKVVVGFIVGPDGFVQDARVLKKKTTLNNDRIHECVLDIRRWQFPKPDDDRIHPIEYPFNLKTLK